MSVIRQVARGGEGVPAGHAQAAVTPSRNRKINDAIDEEHYPEALCRRCKHTQRNKSCHQLFEEPRKSMKNNGKAQISVRSFNNEIYTVEKERVLFIVYCRLCHFPK